MPSPLLYRSRLYSVRNGGMVTSYETGTGNVVLDRVRLGPLGLYVSSLVAADGRIYAASESGTIVVFRAGDTWTCWRGTTWVKASPRRRQLRDTNST